jgi:hypothetical protein
MDNKPQIPTLKESQNEKKGGAPALKIKGLQSGLSLIERLKQFKKKDLAFILAGLGVLFMAPLAEHFMMSPSDQAGDGTMTPGFSSGKGGSPFGSAASPYDPGVNGLAPGGVAGGGSDVITPLNVRDPSALVMGPGATQQAPATASASPTTPPPPPPAKEDSKWNDAIAAGKAAASAATKKAALPVPKVPLSAGGLRGLGAVSGGSGSSFSLPPVSSNGLASGHVNQSNGLTGTNGSGFKGVARGPGSGGNTGRLEALKNAAAQAGGDFNRSGPASSNLEAAASRDMGGGSGGGAGEGGSHDDKATSGSQSKDSKSPGESLEFLRQKSQMEKDIAYADELRKSQPCGVGGLIGMGGPNLECNKLKGEMMKTMMMKGLVEPVAGVMGDLIKGWLEPDAAGQVICCPDGKIGAGCMPSMKKPGKCGTPAPKDQGAGAYCIQPGSGLLMNIGGGAVPGPGGSSYTCSGGADGTPDGGPNGAINGTGGAPGLGDPAKVDGGIPGARLGKLCTDTQTNSVQSATTGATDVTHADTTRFGAFGMLNDASKRLASVEAWANGTVDDQRTCGAVAELPGTPEAGKDTNKLLLGTKNSLQTLVKDYKETVSAKDDAAVKAGADMQKKAADAVKTALDKGADIKATDVETASKGVKDAFDTGDNNLAALVQKAKGDTQKALDRVANQQTYAQIDQDFQTVNEKLTAMATQVKAAQQSITAAKGASQFEGLTPYEKQLDAEATRWQTEVTRQQKDYDAQVQARKALQPSAQSGELAKAHQASVAYLDASGAQGAGMGLGPDGTPNSYRGAVTQELTKLQPLIAAQDPLAENPQTAEAAKQAKTQAVDASKGVITPLDPKVQQSQQAAGAASQTAGSFIAGQIDNRIGTLAPGAAGTTTPVTTGAGSTTTAP